MNAGLVVVAILLFGLICLVIADIELRHKIAADQRRAREQRENEDADRARRRVRLGLPEEEW